MIEFMPWYDSGQQMVRCAGDDGCGAMVMSGDTELHQQWHDKVWPHIEVTLNPEVPRTPRAIAEDIVRPRLGPRKGRW